MTSHFLLPGVVVDAWLSLKGTNKTVYLQCKFDYNQVSTFERFGWAMSSPGVLILLLFWSSNGIDNSRDVTPNPRSNNISSKPMLWGPGKRGHIVAGTNVSLFAQILCGSWVKLHVTIMYLIIIRRRRSECWWIWSRGECSPIFTSLRRIIVLV